MPNQIESRLRAGLATLALELPEPALAALLAYLELIEGWNARFNLTAVRDREAMVTRHLLDSLAVHPYVHGARLIDLGSGAGLPGIPLAIAAPERKVTLVDSNGKKASFLRTVVRELGLGNVEVAEARVEKLAGQYDCVTARAFASLADMLQWGAHLLAAGGSWLAMKGRYPADEVAKMPAGFRLERSVALRVPGLDAERHLLIIRKHVEDES